MTGAQNGPAGRLAGRGAIRRLPAAVLAAGVLAVGVLTGCGAATSGQSGAVSRSPAAESNPPGDIPDDQAFVPFSPPSGLFTVSVPEGWARRDEGPASTFTDKLNSVRIETVEAAVAPDVASAIAVEVPALQATARNYTAGDVTTVSRTAGDAILITYGADGAPDPVTGKTVTNSVERYEFWQAGQEVILTLSGPTGADNVDPWLTVTNSFAWTG